MKLEVDKDKDVRFWGARNKNAPVSLLEKLADDKEEDVYGEEEDERILLGLTQRQRYKIYAWGALAIVLGGIIWSLSYLRPWRWHTYTDDIAVKKVAREVELGYVLWDEAETVGGEIAEDNFVNQTVISSDGARMVYVSNVDNNNTNLFLRAGLL